VRRPQSLGDFLARRGRLFSEELGIDVRRQPFRWLLASILFGRRISAEIAMNTYRAFARRRLLTPRAILRAGWDNLIPVMGEGGYVRYDGMTSTYVLDVCRKLSADYGGDVEALRERARTPQELERLLLGFRGIGPVTARIFLRELRGVWTEADPPLTDVELVAARRLGFTRSSDPRRALADLKALWRRRRVAGYDFRHFEAALVRAGLELRRRASTSKRRASDSRD
jgi:endonuclease III